MTQTKTKKALLMSVLSMVLCVAMLVGMTFAWFTDTASTGVNKIQAGELKIKLLGANDRELSKDTSLTWQKAAGHEAEEVLWEPNCTYNLETFKVRNAGNLAVKYKVILKATDITNKDGKTLLDVLEWKVNGKNVDFKTLGNGIEILADQQLPKGATMTIDVSAHMKAEAGNDYQGLKIDGFGVEVYATQLNSENDSYGPDYDKDAPLPTVVSNQADVNSAIQDSTNKNVVLELPKGKTITLDNGIANEGSKSRNVTFVGDETQTVDVVTNAITAEGGELNYQRGSSFTFKNLTVQAGEGNFDGIVCDELTYKNCTIKGKLTLYGKATFINCTFENGMENQYSIWTWGGTDVTFEGCTFNTNGKAILLYGQATGAKPTNLVVTNCEFNDRNIGSAGKAAIEIGNDYNATYTLTVNEAIVNGFAAGKNTGSKLWANKNSMDAAHLSVTIDGTKVQ